MFRYVPITYQVIPVHYSGLFIKVDFLYKALFLHVQGHFTSGYSAVNFIIRYTLGAVCTCFALGRYWFTIEEILESVLASYFWT